MASSPPGITCQGVNPDCSEIYDYGTVVTLTATPATGSVFSGWSSNCVAAGLSCTITVTQMDTVVATFAIEQHTVTVVKEGSGTGTVTGIAAGGTVISCGADCSEVLNYNTTVTLTATVTAPQLFVGWLGDCSGTGPCVVQMTADRTVRAVFSPPPNKMFVTSQSYVIGSLGGLSGADARCQALANSLSPPLGGTYRAWLSSSTTDAVNRFGTASGWVRVDGKPFANTAADLGAHRIFHPGRITESGVDIGDGEVVTATEVDGTYSGAGDCSQWTSTSGIGAWNGQAGAMASTWTHANSQACSTAQRLYCFGIDRPATVIPQVTGAVRRAFMRYWTPGGGLADADAFCQADATANNLPGTYKALLATSTASAISRFNTSSSAPPWVRVDNVPILPTAIAWASVALTAFDSVPNLSANGTFSWSNYLHWTGAGALTATGSTSTTCTNWTVQSQTALGGSSAYSAIGSFMAVFTSNQCNFNSGTIVCLQE